MVEQRSFAVWKKFRYLVSFDGHGSFEDTCFAVVSQKKFTKNYKVSL